jgi:hypothetical protein
LEGIKEVLRDLVSSCKMAPPCFLAPYLIMWTLPLAHHEGQHEVLTRVESVLVPCP